MKSLLLTASLLAVCVPAQAQVQPQMQHGAMPAPDSPAAAGMMAAMDRMNQAMAATPMTGDIDRDFIAMMIPHHHSAIDMARLELQSGKDPAIRRLAREIIASQQKEIAQMQRWLAKPPAHAH